MRNKSLLLNIVLLAVIVVLGIQLGKSTSQNSDPNGMQGPNRFTKAHGVKTNPTLTTIFNRKSVRHYTTEEVSNEQLILLAKAGMAAPTAVDKRPWAFVSVTDRKVLDRLAEVLPYARMLKKASAAIVVCGDLNKALEGSAQILWVQDCSAASENVLLAAESIGLGAVWTGVYPDDDKVAAVREILGIPDRIVPLNVIAIGYPTGEEKPKDKWDASNLHWEKW